jgi:hypothetical protein
VHRWLIWSDVGLRIYYPCGVQVGEEDNFVLSSSAPPLPSPEWKSGSLGLRSSNMDPVPNLTLNHGGGSSESFSSLPSVTDLNNTNWDSVSNGQDEEAEVAACVAVLDRAIAWAKARSQKMSTQPSRTTSRSVAPIGSPIAEENGKVIKEEEEKNVKKISEAVTVIDKTLSAVKRRPSQQKLL